MLISRVHAARFSVRSTLTQCLLTLFFVAFSSSLWAAVDPVKSPNDSNSYRFIELDNGLKALLISDPDADKAAAALNVAVGSGDDPVGREGIAHFLEHMLFLGTKKYPKPGEYQQFIASHGGNHNAFTAFQDTNYFFDIQADSLEPALDRFAQQFSAPLFTADLVDREKNAVNSEYSSKLKDDGRRFYSAEKATFNPEHPLSHFAVGSLDTLADRPDSPVRDDLVAFWKAHYSANLMTLVVYGKQSLGDLEKMVRPRFSAIENRQLSATEHTQPMYAPGFLPALLQVQSLKEVRQLELSFPLPSQRDDYADKPTGYIANLLGHEGQGSLLNVLKNAGLAERLSAGQGQDTGHEATLNIQMSLTPKGLERWQSVVDLTFDYIEMIRNEGIKQQYFDEISQLSETAFRFQEASSPIGKVSGLAMQMQDVAPKDILQAPYMMESYAPQKYAKVLDRLNRNNVRISILSQQPLADDAPHTERYDTVYQVKSLKDTELAKAPEELVSELKSPEPNPFIPENFDMVTGDTMDKPMLLKGSGEPTLWYARDKQFNTPKANVYMSLRSPLTHDSARGQVLTQLLVDSIQDNLNAYAYPAQLAGLDYAVYSHLRGITLRVGGYNDKLHVLMRRIMGQVAHPEIAEDRFEINRDRLLESLRNEKKQKPVQQATSELQSALIEGAWSAEDQLAEAKTVTLEELRAFADKFLDQIDPVMLAHGNLTEAAAINLQQQAHALLLEDSTIAKVPRSGVRQLPEELTDIALQVDHPDTGYALYIQGNSTRFAERARYQLLAQIIGTPFYESIRTQQQLGYIVSGSSFEMLEVPALGFMVQSPSADMKAIDSAVDKFLNDFEAQLTGLSEKDLDREKQAVISQLLERDRQLGEISERYWREIDRGATGFDSREKLADAIRGTELDDLITLYKKTIKPRQHALRVFTATEAPDTEEQSDALRSAPFVY
ncbi:insulinase family protein [Marinobacter sp. V034]|uniref:insulinase family protein n=1 Tax=Marinobacter sp. V034 TaxID=3459610 RepID=UPI004043D118